MHNEIGSISESGTGKCSRQLFLFVAVYGYNNSYRCELMAASSLHSEGVEGIDSSLDDCDRRQMSNID